MWAELLPWSGDASSTSLGRRLRGNKWVSQAQRGYVFSRFQYWAVDLPTETSTNIGPNTDELFNFGDSNVAVYNVLELAQQVRKVSMPTVTDLGNVLTLSSRFDRGFGFSDTSVAGYFSAGDRSPNFFLKMAFPVDSTSNLSPALLIRRQHQGVTDPGRAGFFSVRLTQLFQVSFPTDVQSTAITILDNFETSDNQPIIDDAVAMYFQRTASSNAFFKWSLPTLTEVGSVSLPLGPNDRLPSFRNPSVAGYTYRWDGVVFNTPLCRISFPTDTVSSLYAVATTYQGGGVANV